MCRLSCSELFSWRILCTIRKSADRSDSQTPTIHNHYHLLISLNYFQICWVELLWKFLLAKYFLTIVKIAPIAPLTHLVTADWAQLLQAILGVRLAGADHAVLHVAACKDVARVSHDGRDVLRAGQAGHGVIILDGGGHPGHPIVGAGLHGHQVHWLWHAQEPLIGIGGPRPWPSPDAELTGVYGLETLDPRVEAAQTELARAHGHLHHGGLHNWVSSVSLCITGPL